MKVGDRVKVNTNSRTASYFNDMIGEIIFIDYNTIYPFQVDFGLINRWVFKQDELELVKESKSAQKAYKIRRKSDGLFSNGGSGPGFTNKGKTWSQKGHVTQHLFMLGDYRTKIYKNCEIVEYELKELSAKEIE